jgi:phosphoesterase RecJ-like protein
MDEPTLRVPDARREALAPILTALGSAQHVVLTTHVNADGDGAGSEAAVAAWLAARGKHVHIVNPTVFPDSFRHLIEDHAWLADAGSADGAAALRAAEVVLVLDTGEPKRVGRVAGALTGKTVLVIDHHLPNEGGFDGLILQDRTACATGELVYDLLTLADLHRPWPARILEAIYTAILTDTGAFRYSNTTPRTHLVAADLLAQGVDPEDVYRRVYATVPLSRIRLLRHALDSLEVDGELPITWMSIDRKTMDALGASSDDLEGIIEHARSIEGTEVAVLFRETADGSTKISLRSTGEVNVNAVARIFGGGGHEKASGALIGARMTEVQPRVLDAVRQAVRSTLVAFRHPAGAD